MLGRGTMSESAAVLPWQVVRHDDETEGNRYRIARFATQAEAQKIADGFDTEGQKHFYRVERVGPDGHL
ncbi:SPOR domain-containing protein [uncultured Streptomyces sp.]|uniref:SPOR domain-containing protein n=1 Tax=uncultured Streptomyces sp. TaxID=174707 RepID=UPI0026171249|nr:SPOR domain-containing protein [uncultured Streptomyces sp.]